MPTATASKERPILFSGPMVRAIIEGRKTQTRRVLKPQPSCPATMFDYDYRGRAVCIWPADHVTEEGLRPDYFAACPYGRVGDRLWVREAWWQPPIITSKLLREGADTWPKAGYAADGDTQYEVLGWKKRPSIHMPRWASRITLEITDIRVQRVREISDMDAMAEGVEWNRGPCRAGHTNPISAFKSLWDSINSKRCFGWEVNPWAWAITFKRVEA